MMRSLYSGVAGLKTHQTKMDVIGNNIANVNTTAYKSSSITFSDLMSQTTQAASGPNASTGTGGTNARQIGLGVKTGAISSAIDTQGSAQSTGNPFDIMITGDNFFVVSNGSSNFFTRDGSFYVDGAGNLAMASTGYNVMGWQVDEETMTIKRDTVSALRIMSAANMTYPPEATQKAYLAGILDQNDTDVNSDAGKTVNLKFFDALGYSYTARITMKASDTSGNYSVELSNILDADGNSLDLSKFTSTGTIDNLTELLGNKDTTQDLTRSVKFDTTNYAINGGQLYAASDAGFTTPLVASLATPTDEEWDVIAKAYNFDGSTEEFKNLYVITDATATPPTRESVADLITGNNSLQATLTITKEDGTTDTVTFPDTGFTADGRYFDGGTLNFNTSTGAFTGINGGTNTTLTLSLSQLLNADGTSNFEDIEIDFSEMSMFNNNGTSTVTATSGDENGNYAGRMLGDMIGVSIQNNGMIYASYDNGMTKLLGQIATASFANASGLSKEGDNLYSSTMNSGEFDGIGVDVTANGGYMTTGVLEMSNVDLSTEFTSMITTQRGFQANSRIITVSDTLLEELTNLKR